MKPLSEVLFLNLMAESKYEAIYQWPIMERNKFLTCGTCGWGGCCEWSGDLYNTNGDCLASK